MKQPMEEVQATETKSYTYNGKEAVLYVVEGVAYIGLTEIKNTVGHSVYNSAIKYCDVKKVNGTQALPVHQCTLLRAPYKKHTDFFKTIMGAGKATVTPLSMVPSKPKSTEVLGKTPKSVYEYISDMKKANFSWRGQVKDAIKQTKKGVDIMRECIKEIDLHNEGLDALVQVLELDDAIAEEAEQNRVKRQPRAEWLRELEWDYLSPANFSKIWGNHKLIVTISEADKKLYQRGKTGDSVIWMNYGAKVKAFATKHGVEPLKNTVSSNVQHKYNSSTSTNLFPLWLLELYFTEQHGPCLNNTLVGQRKGIKWVEDSLRVSNGCGGRLKAM